MSSTTNYPNSVNGILYSSAGDVALGRSSTGQVDIGHDHISGPVDGGTSLASTALSLAWHKERSEFITGRAPPAYPLLEPVPLPPTRPKWHTSVYLTSLHILSDSLSFDLVVMLIYVA